jgi:DNA repair protein SbcC/Rad50
LDSAKEAQESARENLDEAREAAASAQTSARERRTAANTAETELRSLQAQILNDERELEGKVGSTVRGERGDTVEARVLVAVKRMVELRRLNQQANDALQQTERKLEEGRKDLERLTQRVQLLQSRIETMSQQIQATQLEVSNSDAEITKVTRAADPLAEREATSLRERQLSDALEAARGVQQSAQNELGRASERVEGGKQAVADASGRAAEARARSREAASVAGFADEKAVSAVLLPETEIERLAAEVDQYRLDLHAVQRRVSDLTEELEGREVSDEEVEAVQREVAAGQQRLDHARHEETQLEGEIRIMVDRVEKAATLTRELEGRRRDHRIYRRLADDLRTDRFQAFVLDETFRELASGASIRLTTLSGRYTLEYHDDAFYVVDHDNADEQRSTDTLSGGETFLASLALALELSEQVQRAASAVPLDSLFIDEGFGTLDPATLDTAAGAIESLPIGGRMVGIITHVRELADRLPARVLVEKRSDGSRLRIDLA